MKQKQFPKYQSHSRTSVEAALFVQPFVGRDRQRVFREIAMRGERGMSDEEIADDLHMNPSTARPRRIELFEAGLIEECGSTTNRSGAEAVLWRITGRKYDNTWFRAKAKAKYARRSLERELVAAAEKYATYVTLRSRDELLDLVRASFAKKTAKKQKSSAAKTKAKKRS